MRGAAPGERASVLMVYAFTRSYTSVYLSAVYRGWSLVTPHPPHTARLAITSPASQRLTRLISFALWRAQSDSLGRKQFHPLEKLNGKEMRAIR
jgi:hypothetical protein